VNGVLLEATTADDLQHLFGVDNRSLRNKILQKRTEVMKKEVELCDSWFLKYQSSKSLPSSSVYVIFDSSDLPIARRVWKDLRSGGFQVHSEFVLFCITIEKQAKVGTDILVACM
jgi:hypothetical protein